MKRKEIRKEEVIKKKERERKEESRYHISIQSETRLR